MQKVSTVAAKLLSGLKWTSSGQILRQVISIIFTIVLARLLSPSIFGLLSMVMIFSELANLIIDFGIGNTLIQKKNPSDLFSSSLFWLNLILGLIMFSLIFLFAPIIANFFAEEQITTILRIISVNYLILAFQVIPKAFMTKNLRFKQLFAIEIFAVISAGILGITAAILQMGVWALVIQYLCISILMTTLTFTMVRWRPSFQFSWYEIRNSLTFSGSMITNSLLSYLVNNVDNLIIGKYFGSSLLGVYTKSFSLIRLPVSNISVVFTKVLFPVLSQEQNLLQTRSMYTHSVRAVTALSFPLMATVFVAAEEIVPLILGNQWLDAIFYVRIFSLSAMAMSVNALLGSVIMSLGRSDLIFREALIKRGIILSGILVGLRWGVAGIAVGRMMADILNMFITFIHVKKSIGISIKHQLSMLLNILLATLLAIFLVEFSGPLYEELHFILILTIKAIVVLFIISLFLYLTNDPVLSTLAKVFRNKKSFMK